MTAIEASSTGGAFRHLFLPALLFILGNAWAAQYVTAKVLGDAGVDPFGALFAVHIILVAAFGGWLWSQGKLYRPNPAQVRFFLLAALLGNVLSLLAELAAAHHIPASLLAIIAAMAPLFTLLLALALRCEAVSARSILAIAMGFAGAGMILIPGAVMGGGLVWILVAFGAPIGFAAMGILMSARWPEGLDPIQVAFGISLAGFALVTPLTLLWGEPLAPFRDGGAALPAVAVLALTLVLEYAIFAALTRIGGAVYASCADFIATGMGLFWAWAFFAEVPTLWMWTAAALSVATLFVIKRAETGA